MDDYKAMYYALFDTVTKVIETLKAAQMQSEEAFLSSTKKAESIASNGMSDDIHSHC